MPESVPAAFQDIFSEKALLRLFSPRLRKKNGRAFKGVYAIPKAAFIRILRRTSESFLQGDLSSSASPDFGDPTSLVVNSEPVAN